jgi:hypothetical protein
MIPCKFCKKNYRSYILTIVELVGECYKRDKGSLHDDDREVCTEWDCAGCGVRYDNAHHIGCDGERCPRCKGQLIGCDCGAAKETDEKRETYYDEATLSSIGRET